MSESSSGNDPLAILRVRFVARCAEDLVVVRAGPDAPDLARVVHRIAGAAGIFGYDALGALAGRMDDDAHAGARFEDRDLAALAQALEQTIAGRT
jgi:HPt (histidine-containing phosphotransfer) domain-containing protein